MINNNLINVIFPETIISTYYNTKSKINILYIKKKHYHSVILVG